MTCRVTVYKISTNFEIIKVSGENLKQTISSSPSVTAPPTVSVPAPHSLPPPPPPSSSSSSAASQQNRSETPDSACDVRSLPNSADSPSSNASEKGNETDPIIVDWIVQGGAPTWIASLGWFSLPSSASTDGKWHYRCRGDG